MRKLRLKAYRHLATVIRTVDDRAGYKADSHLPLELELFTLYLTVGGEAGLEILKAGFSPGSSTNTIRNNGEGNTN